MIKPGDKVNIRGLNKNLLIKDPITKDIGFVFYYKGDDNFKEGYYDFIAGRYIGDDKELERQFNELTESDIHEMIGDTGLAEGILEIINDDDFDLEKADKSLKKWAEIINNEIQGLN